MEIINNEEVETIDDMVINVIATDKSQFMGMYLWVTESDIKSWSSVEDIELNELFQEVRHIDSNYLISEQKRIIKGFFGKIKIEYDYQLYHLNGHEALYITCGSYKSAIMTFFFGFLSRKAP